MVHLPVSTREKDIEEQAAWICEHDWRRTQCKECGRSAICEHTKRKFLMQGL